MSEDIGVSVGEVVRICPSKSGLLYPPLKFEVAEILDGYIKGVLLGSGGEGGGTIIWPDDLYDQLEVLEDYYKFYPRGVKHG